MTQKQFIKIRGCKVHNLKNVNLDIPKNKLVVITGLSGSGKTSLAFDTLYAEGQRRYVESLSSYARQFLGVMDKPEVEKIEGISPAISIDQRKAVHNPRSTVGTMTEIYDYLRLLFARIGVPHCPSCDKVISRQTIDQITDQVFNLSQEREIIILGPVVRGKKGEHRKVLEEAQRAGFIRVRIDGIIYRIEEALETEIERQKKHEIEIVVDRLKITKDLERARVVDSLETALKLGKGLVIVDCGNQKDLIFSEHFACEECGINLPEIQPRLFSFNSPYGACPSCSGLGEKLEVDSDLVIPNPDLTIREGAIFPWARASHRLGRQGYFKRELQKVSEGSDFSLDFPVKDLSERVLKIILYGEGGFEGVIPNLKRRHKETESDHTRKEIEKYMIKKECPSCKGKRLRFEALSVKMEEKSIDQVVSDNISQNKRFFVKLKNKLSKNDLKIAEPVIKEIIDRLQFLTDVSLGYLSLDRKTVSLAGGEEQRARLATQIGSKLTGVLYILDEPSIGLHPRDQDKLISTLKQLRDLNNSVIVVEHDPETIKESDWIVDIGPEAGKNGGRIIFEGTPKQLEKSKTLTGEYISGRKKVLVKKNKNKEKKYLTIEGAREHNLKNIDVKIPLKRFVCITGVSGSGKSSLINDILAKALHKHFYSSSDNPLFRKNNGEVVPLLLSSGKGGNVVGEHDKILGIENLKKVVTVDQSPIGRTSRSNPATYTGIFGYIRTLFSKTKESKVRGYRLGRFSFNVKGGRCESCQGQGEKKIEMYFLPPVFVKCKECKGKRYNKETLEIEYRGRNISQVLEMTVSEAMEFFKNIPPIYRKLETLKEVGLDYLELGQPAPSLSGGEAQRIKLSSELSKKGRGKTLYILDEPTTGLHSADVRRLLVVLRKLVEQGNTVLATEHNLDFINNADWIIDLGPEGGERGGEIVAEGNPREIAKRKRSHTGKFLRILDKDGNRN